MLNTLTILWQHSRPFFVTNSLVLLLALTIIVERFISLTRYSISAEPFTDQLIKFIREGQIDKARKLCAAAPSAALARVLKAGIDSSNRGEAEISAAMEETMLEVTPLVSKRIPALFPLANIATLVGLIGTIRGLIVSFGALSSASPETKATILSTGISEAMNNTLFGLSIAVLCIALQLYLQTRAKGLIEDLEFYAVKLENILGRRIAGDLENAA
jgi:biopolymer transport protein ExbB/TolQ